MIDSSIPPTSPSSPINLNGVTSHQTLRLMYSLSFGKVRARLSIFLPRGCPRRYEIQPADVFSFFVVNEYTAMTAVQFIVCSITQPEKWGYACFFQTLLGGKRENKANLTSSPTANLLPLKTMPLLPSSWSHWFVLGDNAGCCEITPAPLISRRRGGEGMRGWRQSNMGKNPQLALFNLNQ